MWKQNLLTGVIGSIIATAIIGAGAYVRYIVFDKPHMEAILVSIQNPASRAPGIATLIIENRGTASLNDLEISVGVDNLIDTGRSFAVSSSLDDRLESFFDQNRSILSVTLRNLISGENIVVALFINRHSKVLPERITSKSREMGALSKNEIKRFEMKTPARGPQ